MTGRGKHPCAAAVIDSTSLLTTEVHNAARRMNLLGAAPKELVDLDQQQEGDEKKKDKDSRDEDDAADAKHQDGHHHNNTKKESRVEIPAYVHVNTIKCPVEEVEQYFTNFLKNRPAAHDGKTRQRKSLGKAQQ